MFCSECGNQIEPQSSFCSECGNSTAPVQRKDQTTAQALKAPTTESVVWVFSAQRKLSLLKIIPCNIVFMEDKTILAHLTPALQKAESAKVSAEIKQSGIGFFKGSAAMMKFWADFSKRYYTMAESAILAEDALNRVLPYQNIVEVLFRGFSENVSFDENGTSSVTQGKLNFTLAGGETIKFTHSMSSGKTVQETLYRLFGGKLKYKR